MKIHSKSCLKIKSPSTASLICFNLLSLQRSLLLITFIFFTFFPMASKAESKDATLFLPLKINTAGKKDHLQVLADKALKDVLVRRSISEDTVLQIMREDAETIFDYQGGWPPSENKVRELFGQREGQRYVAVGSLTQLGNQISIDVKLFDSINFLQPTYYFEDVESADTLIQAMDKLLVKILSYTSRDFLIASIIIKGNERIDTGAIRRQIKSRANDHFDPKALNTDLKQVFKMGYFDDIKINVETTDKGKEVTFEIKEKPVIGQVIIKGTKELEEETVRESVIVISNTIVNPRKVKESVDNIIALYKEKGFYNTKVDSSLSYPKPERVDIRFTVEEGPKIYTKEVRFVGNRAYKAKQLKKIIETSTKGFFSWITESGLLKRDVLEQDVARLTAFYHNNGYIEAKVGEPEIVQDGKWLYVSFNIFEGDRYKVGVVDLTGDLIAEKESLLALIKIHDQEYLSRKTLREDILRLTDYYAENGYAFADVKPAINENKIEKTVGISIDIVKADLVYIERITIRGNTRTRDKVIRRELKIKEKGIFNSKALRKSHERLIRLDFFEDVSITPESSLDKSKMDVTIEVKEKPTGSFSIGAGYSSVENLMVMGEISQNNFLGKGQRLSFKANLSSTTNRFSIGFTEPHYKDSKLSIGYDIYNWEKEYDDYTKESKGGGIRFGYPIKEHWSMGFGYGYENADLSDIDANASQIIKDSADIHVTSFVNFGVNRDTRDRLYGATKGSKNAINVKYAGGPLGGDSAFTKYELTSSWYFPAFLETTYHLKGVVGQVTENSGGELPIYEKFYLGGIRNIRGFPSNRISPVDPVTLERVGGENMWYVNAEWIFPLSKDLGVRGVLFFDAGNVYETDWDFDDIKKSVGAGFRWLSPMGPLRLEWGYVIDPTEDEDQSNWDFSIGGEF